MSRVQPALRVADLEGEAETTGEVTPGSDGAKAAHWYRMAAEAADRGGDPRTRVWVRGRAAIAVGYEGAALPVARMFAWRSQPGRPDGPWRCRRARPVDSRESAALILSRCIEQ